eukprot:scaffold11360_cov114-Isochrysis_galbana.AAC.5
MAIASPPSRTFCGAFPRSSPLGGWKKIKMNDPYTCTRALQAKKASLTRGVRVAAVVPPISVPAV